MKIDWKRLGYFSVEFGQYGWKPPERPLLPCMVCLGLVRISIGRGCLDDGVFDQMATEGQMPAFPRAPRQP